MFYAVDTARNYERLPPELVCAPGSIPEAPWGLPVVPTTAEWEDLVAWMWDVAKRLGIA